ncbi:protein DD3-3 [Exaiptasia diaphana]|uniref:Protein DD3-3 n=1 Tax=Exaiptasia diaphana TaxID=2652724 RepID=A0A913YQN0_EXADI|nr:protein DD3-3 [Exaiptasia diaphana]KXJ20058.1 Protein DD3-3 [Exaiptasia diaphana]
MDLKAILLVLFSLFAVGLTDINMHNPRGCNNRLNEPKRGRRNAKRLFDSQNNNRGGHNVGKPMYYYSGSYLPIQWAHQHTCGDQNNNCEVVIQYMCDKKLRDGATTATIPDNPKSCKNGDCNSDVRYGMHEDHDYYKDCKTRERNRGLFTSTQRLRGQTARFTRQERKGTRYAYECPEERDYYPYWHPTPWKDIAVLTNNAMRCEYYKQQSENVKGRGYCKVDGNLGSTVIPNNKAACLAFKHPNATRVQWLNKPAHGIPPPDCVLSQWSRDNHQGNTIGGYFMSYNWKVPDIDEDNCVVRIRYNISTGEYDGWDPNVNYKKNGNMKINIGMNFGLTFREARARGYFLRNNPSVMIFSNAPKLRLRVNIDTGNFGRTFQDRSHVFSIRKRPASLKGKKIHNVNVRGKRGNIVQVFPSVEYDFVPNTLVIPEGDYVHFQWTGSDTNPRNNDGQGKRGTDRSNVILIHSEPNKSPPRVYGQWSRNYPAKITNGNFLGFTEKDLKTLATISGSPYFDLPPRMVKGCGTYHYISTRNNAFSNRSQKGRIIVNSCK